MQTNTVERNGLQDTGAQRAGAVKELFEQADWYLQKWRCAIRIRTETVREFVGKQAFRSILDIGCGDGSISTQLLKPGTQLTLNDLSSTMLSVAFSRVPAELENQVRCVNEDFSRADLAFQPFDLIICVGVLAHVASPQQTIDRLTSLLSPGGTVVVECTDTHHPLTRLVTAYASLQTLFSKASYRLNPVTPTEIAEMFRSRGFAQVAMYRHVLPFFGMSRFFSQDFLYKVVRTLCGYPSRNRNLWLGNHYIFQFKKELAD
jgi:2-polyprenyl-3-methyl-5-hydroxy-6-metoxy-1,4-benzoquinol methylase